MVFKIGLTFILCLILSFLEVSSFTTKLLNQHSRNTSISASAKTARQSQPRPQSQRPPSLTLPDLNYGLTDEEFRLWLLNEVKDAPGRNTYDAVFQDSIQAIIKWRQRFRGNPMVWKRIFKKDRVIKELIESAPIIENVKRLVIHNNNDDINGKYTIMDLCCGKGYLSMFLSEILPSDKVERFILIDKAWAIASKETKELKPHHMNWDHIYGNIPSSLLSGDDDSSTYFTTWPIPLYTSKQDLKQSCNQRQMKKHIFNKTKGPIILLAVHLCGTLSLKAVDMFNTNQNVKLFALKPCCLPPMIHAQRGDVFKIGNHEFDAQEVCSNGSFNKKDWSGPPRWHLQPKFDKWAENLFQGIQLDDDEGEEASSVTTKEEEAGGETREKMKGYRRLISSQNGSKAKDEIIIQVDGGFQNTYMFAERKPLTSSIWETS